jgi:hypothetical protein
MSSDNISANPPARCPKCGAKTHSATARVCWLCQAEFGIQEGTSLQEPREHEQLKSIKLPDATEDSPAWIVFGLLALLLCFSLLAASPGFLILLMVLALPALIRTCVAVSRQRPPGGRLTGITIFSTFLSSLGIAFLVGGASVIAFMAAFFVACLASLPLLANQHTMNWILFISVGAGLIASIPVAVILCRSYWPRKG